jgi:hypothetical protein
MSGTLYSMGMQHSVEITKPCTDAVVHVSLLRVKYIILLTVTELMLTLELESAETNERWSGEFTAER